MESGLETRFGARRHMRGDRRGVETALAGVRGVGVGLVQEGGVRAQRPVHEEVAGRAHGTEFTDPPGTLRVLHRLGPVAEDPGAGLFGGQPQERGEVLLVGDLGARALVHGADAQRGGVRECGALGPRPLRRGDGPVGRRAHRVVGVAGQGAVGVVAGPAGDARHQVEERRGHDGRVDVDPGQVQGPASGRLVEFPARRGALLGPAGRVPSVTEDHRAVRLVARERADAFEGFGKRARPGEVEPGESESGRRGVDVGVGESGGDQGPLQVDHLVDTAREGVGRPLGPDPGDMAAFDDHRGGERIGGAVDVSTAQQHGAVFALGAVLSVMGTVSRLPGQVRPPPPPRRRAGALRRAAAVPRRAWRGRRSYGWRQPASVRIRVSRCSSSRGLETRTLRM